MERKIFSTYLKYFAIYIFYVTKNLCVICRHKFLSKQVTSIETKSEETAAQLITDDYQCHSRRRASLQACLHHHH